MAVLVLAGAAKLATVLTTKAAGAKAVLAAKTKVAAAQHAAVVNTAAQAAGHAAGIGNTLAKIGGDFVGAAGAALGPLARASTARTRVHVGGIGDRS